MLKIQGYLGGKTFATPTVISAKDFAELYGGLPDFNQDEVYILKLNPDRIKMIPGEGEERVPPSLMIPSAYTVSLPNGDSFTLQYYKTETPLGNGVIRFAPDSLTFTGRANHFGSADYDKFVYMATHGQCATSKTPSEDNRYFVYDAKKEEDLANATAEKQSQMFEVLMSASDALIVSKSLAMVVDRMSTNVPTTAPAATHKNGLVALMIKNPVAFQREWYNEGSTIKGLLLLAIDRKELVQGAEMGKTVWRWKYNGVIATYVAPNADPLVTLVDWANNPENYNGVYNILAEVLSLSTAKQQPAATPQQRIAQAEVSAQEVLVRQANDLGLLSLIKANPGKVGGRKDHTVMLERDGTEQVLTTVVDARAWLKELIQKLETGGEAGVALSESIQFAIAQQTQ